MELECVVCKHKIEITNVKKIYVCPKCGIRQKVAAAGLLLE